MSDAVSQSMSGPLRLLRTPWCGFICSVLLSAFVLLYPIYVIRPFRHQGSLELAIALGVVRFRPIAAAVAIAASFILLTFSWSRLSGLANKIAAWTCVALVIVFALLSRVNVYEMMFHPLTHPTFSSAGRTKLGAREMVIAIRVGGQARAYPIRNMSYHHIVNDVVGGLPIVATY